MKKMILAAENDDNRLSDMMDSLEDDFDYIISGLEKLDRDGKESREVGISIANELHNQLNVIIESIADSIGG